ncbi:MAG: 3-isopropylmalate dehydrogenase [Candidatus Moranbacteria bacterium]|nr:3-isopropylmalate dehydrogenase [Candidatus Moranbacteria bacterium]
MKAKICVIQGDGIGPEIMEQALKVLDQIRSRFNHEFKYEKGLAGGAAWDKYQTHMPQATLDIAENSDAILYGSVGGPVQDQDLPKWKDCEKNSLFILRKKFDLFTNLRPSIVFKPLKNLSILKPSLVKQGLEILIIRELTGGIYFGEHKTENGVATDVMRYSEQEVERIAHVAFQTAQKRKNKLTSVDKANVLDCSKLWRKVIIRVSKKYPKVELNHLYVDNAAMQLVRDPLQFDTIVTENTFGDILSDLASTFAGSLGLLPSASLNSENYGMYEPSGGSAPDIAGKGIANPIAQILCVSMMLKYSFNLEKEARAIEKAVSKTLEQGYRTADIYQEGTQKVSTQEMGAKICENISG